MNRWVEIGRVQREIGNWQCENVDAEGNHAPGCNSRHEEGHHGIFARSNKVDSNKVWQHFLEHPCNYTPSSHACNVSRIGDPEAARDARFAHQLTVYPSWYVKGWLQSAPKAIKARHEWKRYWQLVSAESENNETPHLQKEA